ncbi:MAG TPA: ABC transporter substrate-binding protein [Beijerinckiaceae bacterium]|jgi:ABC-type nitrate/sulfonate/bicarbonate transport system substrate-binding protein
MARDPHETDTTSGPRMDRRRFGALAAGTVGGLLMPAGVNAQGLRKMRFVTPFNFSLSYSTIFYAKAAGFFEKEGLDVEVLNGKGAATAAQLVIAGQAEVARTGGANYITVRVDSGAPLISIATIAQVSPFFMVSAPDRPIRSAQDMKGKTIGVASLGGSMEGTLNLMLRGGGVEGSTVERVRVADVPASFGLIEAKRIDGFMASVSSVVKILAAVPKAHTVGIDDGLPGQVYVASPDALQKNEDLYVRFLRAAHRSASAILDAKELEPIIKAIGGAFEVPGLDDMPTAIADLTQNSRTWAAKGRENLLRNVPEQWADAVKVMRETGMIKKDADPATLYTNALRDKAVGAP